ncbi:Uncharacterized protein APZ42_017099 [Daphnia magna]|uniref:CHK kinase-like domain-containing protein n=1 Tax=Daphnia magna TaxID=35525 RepID=A0A165A113_9CRUS|nr:Uncharacterized protein APZ42_017099 [Daphnia magna]
MADLGKELAEQQLFWKTLFEEKKLAPKLALLATVHVDGITYDDIPQYGQVHVLVQSASTLGDNFMSDTFTVSARLQRRYTTKTYRTFAKVLPSNLLLRQAAYESHTHHHEMHMYLHFFGLLREMHVGKTITLDVPDIYYVNIEEIVQDKTDGSGTCILLEDLSSQGYCMSDKFGGADYRHCHMALTSLAHYHALTLNAVRKWQDPSTGELSNLPHSAKFITQEKTIYELSAVQIAKDFSKRLIEFTQDVKRPDLAEWLQKLMDDRLSEVVLVDTVQSCGPLACILHGDFWNNNMLFKYADEAQQGGSESTDNIPVSLKLIDFQLSRVGHPVTDILYFMYASAKPEVRQHHMQGLLRHYFDTLTADLQLFGVALHYYTWQDFLNDYKKRSLMALFFGGLIMSMGLAKAVVSTMQHLDEEEHLKEPISKGTVNEGEKQEDEFSGKSASFEETLKNMMTSHELNDNPILADRLLKLITEVHSLHNSS